MPKLFRTLFLEPSDIGIQKYSERDVAVRMNESISTDRLSIFDDECLKDFAALVTTVLDEQPVNLTSFQKRLDESS